MSTNKDFSEIWEAFGREFHAILKSVVSNVLAEQSQNIQVPEIKNTAEIKIVKNTQQKHQKKHFYTQAEIEQLENLINGELRDLLLDILAGNQHGYCLLKNESVQNLAKVYQIKVEYLARKILRMIGHHK